MEIRVDRTWDGRPVPEAEQVSLRLEASGEDLVVTVEAPYHGDPPPPGGPGPTEALWEHEVVELFVAHRHSPTYLEVELSPYGHHLVLALTGVRVVAERALPLSYRAVIDGARWTGTARIPVDWLPRGPHRVNATAIHGVGSHRRYLSAQPLGGDRPDFHQPDRFREVVLPVA